MITKKPYQSCDSSYVERVIILQTKYFVMSDYNSGNKRTMPICFTPDQLKIVEDYAKRKGMLNASQAIEDLSGY